jgi:hypothetical protein
MTSTVRFRIGKQIERNYKLANAKEEGCKARDSYESPDYSWDPVSDLITSSGLQETNNDEESFDLPYPSNNYYENLKQHARQNQSEFHTKVAHKIMASTLGSKIRKQIDRNYKLANVEEEGCKARNNYESPDYSWDPASDLIRSSGLQQTTNDEELSHLPYPSNNY